jgi:hypothetical protein
MVDQCTRQLDAESILDRSTRVEQVVVGDESVVALSDFWIAIKATIMASTKLTRGDALRLLDGGVDARFSWRGRRGLAANRRNLLIQFNFRLCHVCGLGP